MFRFYFDQNLNHLRRDMEQLFHGIGLNPEAAAGLSDPVFRVTDQGEHYQVEAALPGIDAEQLDISVLGRQLNISGEFAERELPDDIRWHRRERARGRFEKTLNMAAELDAERVEAEYRHGILNITLPKAASALPRKIAITAG